ncbi:MAG: hypothetical protein ACI4E1_00105 [Lachnospira sp.]
MDMNDKDLESKEIDLDDMENVNGGSLPITGPLRIGQTTCKKCGKKYYKIFGHKCDGTLSC